MELKKKDIIKMMENIDDETFVDLWLIDDGYGKPVITTYDSREVLAYEVYKHIIEAIADGVHRDWQDICENIFIDNVGFINLIGIVKNVHPEVHDDKVYYRIDKEELTDQMHSGLFAPSGGYWVYQRNEYEDSYNGQMLIPIGHKGWMVVYYAD